MKPAMYLAIVFAVLNFVHALPLPQFDDDGQENKDAIYYGFPLFWYRRPFYDDDDDIVNGGQVLDLRRRSSTMSAISVGAGWSR